MKSVRCCPVLFDVLCRLYLLFPFFPIWGCYALERIAHCRRFSFFTNIGRAVAGDDSCSGVAIESSYHHPRLYSLCAIKGF